MTCAHVDSVLIETPLDLSHAEPDLARHAAPVPETTATHLPLRGVMRTVLVVDDERDVRLSIRMLLEFYGYRVIEAANGAEALELLAQSTVSFVITDLHMPRMNGIEFLREVRTTAGVRPRVVAMSGVVHLAHAAPAA